MTESAPERIAFSRAAGVALLALALHVSQASNSGVARASSLTGPLDIELGHQYAQRLLTPETNPQQSKITRNRFFLLARSELNLYSSDTSGTSLLANLGARAWQDVDGSEFDVRAASLVFSKDKVRLEVGFQEIPWGETFGLFIADIVNPRDYRDPLFNELSWIREPVFAANGQIFLGSLTLQGIYTPVPRNNRLPAPGSAYDPAPSVSASLRGAPVTLRSLPGFDVADFGQDSEYGGKASYLFDFGLDAGLLYYRHWNRNVVYELRRKGSSGYDLIPIQRQVDSIGLTASQAAGPFVFRADSLVHFDQPQQMPNFAPSRAMTQWQTILGADLTTESEWTLGAQFHSDNTDLDVLQWASGRIAKKLFASALEAEVFVFGGLNNADLWVQPQLTWNATSSLKLSIRSDHVTGSRYITDGTLPALREQDRVLTWISYRL